MRTTLDIPEEVMSEAQRILGFKSKTDVVIAGLQEIIRRKKIDEIIAMRGKVRFDLDLAKSRRRPGAGRGRR